MVDLVREKRLLRRGLRRGPCSQTPQARHPVLIVSSQVGLDKGRLIPLSSILCVVLSFCSPFLFLCVVFSLCCLFLSLLSPLRLNRVADTIPAPPCEQLSLVKNSNLLICTFHLKERCLFTDQAAAKCNPLV
ncbi:unnamed protein product [Coffea canephora]|uniref:Uncharacterized protein n=1 Tax=Coffea canephora TaxID=49390 RepID=A0A068TQL7_COFCA|nr:unnamed protein product [Coffea canephora]